MIVYYIMSSDWIKLIKAVQSELGCSYKEAMIEASKRKKSGGRTWGLTPEQQKQYISDKRNGKNQRKINSMTVWDPTMNE